MESLTRITILLPAPTTLPMFIYVDDVITELRDVCGGVTASIDIPHGFLGQWKTGRFTYESANILYIFADAPFSLDDEDLPERIEWLEDLKLRCQDNFNWDVIWMTVQRVERISTDDGKREYGRRR